MEKDLIRDLIRDIRYEFEKIREYQMYIQQEQEKIEGRIEKALKLCDRLWELNNGKAVDELYEDIVERVFDIVEKEGLPIRAILKKGANK